MEEKAQKLKKAIRKLRQEQGISQEELARLAGLKLSNLAKLEGGFNSNPTLKTLLAIVKILSRGSIDGLFGDSKKLSGKADYLKIEKLGQRIKFLRQEQGISQEELARQSDLKLSNLAKLEGGFGLNPTLTTLKALARVLTKDSIDKLFAE